MLYEIIRILIPATVSFLLGMAMTPVLTHYLYKHRAWKKRPGKIGLDGNTAHEFNRLHMGNEVRAPRMGGIVVWGSTACTVLGITLLAHLMPNAALLQLDFLSRSQTWVPLTTLLIGALIGLVDDMLVIRPQGEGLRLRYRLAIVIAISTCVGWWFWAKLGIIAVNIPFAAPLFFGPFIIPLFVLISLALYASGVIDGIDGLSGGVFASIFASYTIIAFVQQQVDLAAFCAALVGALLAFLWFNIPPARFYMSDTGTMGLTLCLGTVAFMTDSLGGGVGITVLPIIGFLLVATVASNIVQTLWKTIFGRKLLRIAPLHHHFEALGWPGSKVVMRYWVLSVVCAFAGVIIALAALPTTPHNTTVPDLATPTSLPNDTIGA
jgi:phospho-N-acetylmuramoyl-pentapeptide-transferase